MRKIVKKLSFLIHITLLALLTACGTETVQQVTYDSPVLPPSSSGGGGTEAIRIPSSSQVAPSDILDQVVFDGTGGEGGAAFCPCVYVDGTTLFLEDFQPNQRLRLVAYNEYKFGEAEYYADWLVTVNSTGNLEISVSGNYFPDITFVAFDPGTGKQIGPANRRARPYSIVSQPSSSEYAKISSEVEEVNLRSTAGYTNKSDSDVIAKIPSGATVEIIEGPYSADGLSWWLILWDGEVGWVADHTGSGRTILIFNP